MRLAPFAGAAALALGLAVSAPAPAQEISYSIAPRSKVEFGEVPYAKATRHPNEIYNQHPLLPYRTPAYTYYSYPTFDIRAVEVRPRVRLRRRR